MGERLTSDQEALLAEAKKEATGLLRDKAFDVFGCKQKIRRILQLLDEVTKDV